MTRTVTTLWLSTGNPFADAGAEMMAALAHVDSPEELTLEDVRPLLLRLAKLYAQDDWRKDLSRVFPNAAMTNPAFRGKSAAEPLRRTGRTRDAASGSGYVSIWILVVAGERGRGSRPA